MKFRLGFKKHWDYVVLFLIVLFLCFKNYSPNTWLSGWDNLMPELNIFVNIKRSFLAVWQEYQGLGLVGGMGHATDLVRQLILLPFVLVLPGNFVRYLWHFAMLFVGVFGIHFGLRRQFKLSSPISLAASLFYLLNFGTIQNFWVPFEPFSTFWGFFPWLIFFCWQFLETPSRKNFIKLLIVNLLAIPSFYVQTVFIVYLFCIFILLLTFLLKHRFENKKQAFLSPTLILVTIFCLNAFWLLPFGYFLRTSINNPQQAFGNMMASEETLLRNQKRGSLLDFALLRGYYYDFPDNGGTMLSVWQNHFSQPQFLAIGYILFIPVLVGLFVFIFEKSHRDHHRLAIIGLFFLSCIALLTATFPFSLINVIIRNIEVLNQIFRSPFTKFIVPAIFSFTFLFAFGLEFIASRIKNLKQYLVPVISFASIGAIFFLSYPAFSGLLFYPELRHQIPSDYFQMFDYFKTQPKTARIMNLPSGSFWGWTNYRFGMRGSGFIWYGIEQPIIDRAFDVWNLKNEQYYWELSDAIQRKDINLFNNVLNKYSVSYVIFDNNVFFPDEKIYSKLTSPTKELLDKSDKLSLVKKFGAISVYRTKFQTKPYLVSNPADINYPGFYYQDMAFKNHGDYTSSPKSPQEFPFANLFSERFAKENPFTITKTGQTLTINQNLTNISSQGNFQITDPLPANLGVNAIKKVINIPPAELTIAHPCSGSTENSKYGSEITQNGTVINIYSNHPALCSDWLNTKSLETITEPTVFEVSFEFKSQNQEWPKYCFWDGQTCLNNKDQPPMGFANDWTWFKDRFYYDPGLSKPVNLSLILDSDNNQAEKSISYRNLTIKLYEPSSVKNIDNFTSVSVDKNHILASVPITDTSISVNNPINKHLFTLKQPEQTFINNPTDPYIRLNSSSATNLFAWNFPQITFDHSYLVSVTYRYVKNYPLLFSAFSENGQYMFTKTKLDKSKNWKTDWFIIPKQEVQPFNSGLTLLFNNTTFNNSSSINDIKSIDIYPFPFDSLVNLQTGNPVNNQNPERIYLPSKSNLWRYQIDNFNPENNHLLVLPQSFDNGWSAYYLDGQKKVYLDHVLVNGWSNGWKINNPAGSTTLYLVFWPQILEFIGFGFLIIPVITLFFLKSQKTFANL